MKRTLAVVIATVLLACSAPRGAWAFGEKDVVAMSQHGIPDSLIIAKIDHSHTQFALGTKDLLALNQAGVSDQVVAAMLRTEDAGHVPIYYDRPFWAYDPFWNVGFSWDFYAPYVQGVRPIVVRRGPGYFGPAYRSHVVHRP